MPALQFLEVFEELSQLIACGWWWVWRCGPVWFGGLGHGLQLHCWSALALFSFFAGGDICLAVFGPGGAAARRSGLSPPPPAGGRSRP